jgi:hypothetical protein
LSDWQDACVARKLKLRQSPPTIAIRFCICGLLSVFLHSHQAFNPICRRNATPKASRREE